MPRKKSTQPTTLADRITEIDQLLATNATESADATRDLAADPGDKAALQLAADLANERANLQRQRSALEQAKQIAFERAAAETEEARTARIAELRERVTAMVDQRAEAAAKIDGALLTLAGPLNTYASAQRDLSELLLELFRLSGRDHNRHRVPDVRASTASSSLHESLWRIGLGRIGPEMGVTMRAPGKGLPSLSDALEADANRLTTDIDRLLERMEPSRSVNATDLEAIRRGHDDDARKRADKTLAADVAKQRERTQRRAAAASAPQSEVA